MNDMEEVKSLSRSSSITVKDEPLSDGEASDVNTEITLWDLPASPGLGNRKRARESPSPQLRNQHEYNSDDTQDYVQPETSSSCHARTSNGDGIPSCRCNCSQIIRAAIDDLKDFLRQEIREGIREAMNNPGFLTSFLQQSEDELASVPYACPMPSSATNSLLGSSAIDDHMGAMSPTSAVHTESSSMSVQHSSPAKVGRGRSESAIPLRPSTPVQTPSTREILHLVSIASSRGNFCVLLMRAMYTTDERLRDTNCRGIKKPKFDEPGERLEKIIELAMKYFAPSDEKEVRAEACKRIDEANRRLRYQHGFSQYRGAVHSTGTPDASLRSMHDNTLSHSVGPSDTGTPMSNMYTENNTQIQSTGIPDASMMNMHNGNNTSDHSNVASDTSMRNICNENNPSVILHASPDLSTRNTYTKCGSSLNLQHQ